ncbi:MAG: hypothetical protein ACYDD1_11720 [Caulobacteraceae bacterium]
MAKAQFHRHQKVWVEAVGAWATIDRLIPVWAKGFDEPVKITYDVGLGREFQGHELMEESPAESVMGEVDGSAWRILRARNKWQVPEDCGHHPQPGTFPVVVTDPNDWGGWRVPGAEYDRDPYKIEQQARLLACAPKLMSLARELSTLVADEPEDSPPEMVRLARVAANIIRYVSDQQTAPDTQVRAAQ